MKRDMGSDKALAAIAAAKAEELFADSNAALGPSVSAADLLKTDGNAASAATTSGATTTTSGAQSPQQAEGGDAACWANRVCPECGRLNEAERPVVCELCGAEFG